MECGVEDQDGVQVWRGVEDQNGVQMWSRGLGWSIGVGEEQRIRMEYRC